MGKAHTITVHDKMSSSRNDRFWKLVWIYRPELDGFDPISARANAQSPGELFQKFNAHAPAEKTGKGLMNKVAAHFGKDPSKLNEEAKRVLHINAVMLDDTFIYLYALTDVLKKAFDAVNVQYAPPKGLIRSEEKVIDTSRGGYKGDAMQLKDQVRCTIVCRQRLSDIQLMMRYICDEKFGLRLVKSNLDKHVPLTGYSDLNNVIQCPNDMFAEIQVNSLKGLYGKNSKQDWLEGTDQGKPAYEKLSREIGIDGGFGHKLYEIARNPKNPKAVQNEADALAKEYNGHIMNGNGTPPAGLGKRVEDFIDKYLGKHKPGVETKAPSYNQQSPYHVAIYKLMEDQYLRAKVWKSDLSG
jgi:hypothetical protein